ncbi:MAG: electron transfer flavoprotein subunit beta/FixA family protein [Thermodesulfobacteriota bacterium]|jgi:electron transfer flavoprotein beta subunit
MHIIVCIKQVPDTKQIRLAEKTHTLIREMVDSIINPYDMYALEEGLRLKEQFGGRVTVCSMGPPQAESSLREAITYGADEAVLLSDRAFAGADTWATSYTLAKGIEKIGPFDLILCGKQAMDGDTAQVGPGIAERLSIPYVTWVRKIEDIYDGQMVVQRLMDDGYDRMKLPLPALLTVVKEINEPRVPSLKGKMRAKSQKVEVYGVKELKADSERVGIRGSATQVIKVFPPPRLKEREWIEGTVEEQVTQLLDKLSRQKLIV